MTWKSVRLELAKTREFPNGSASRAYLLRLPLTDDGRIDEVALEELPDQATVRRLWPSEADVSGHLVRDGGASRLVVDLSAQGAEPAPEEEFLDL